jgi:nucleoside 2-deoxyribosyltransferase
VGFAESTFSDNHMQTCFVIQPFDAAKFDKRYRDVFVPAIKAAGLEPYRVDHDPAISIPIDGIEDGIRSSAVCLADITIDNPNVWYELGYAFASGRPVCMVCSDERQGKKYPFDIQHRTIIGYTPESPSDFAEFQGKLTARLKALVANTEVLKNIAHADPLKEVAGLSQPELAAMAIVAGQSFLPDGAVSAWVAQREAEKAGITQLGFNLAVRRLTVKTFLSTVTKYDDDARESCTALQVTDDGWGWIEKNENLFNLQQPTGFEGMDDKIPF